MSVDLNETQIPQEVPAEQLARPAVGIVGRGDESDAVAGAVLRARDSGYFPIVVADGHSDQDVRRFAELLNVPLFTGYSTEAEWSPHECATRIAREVGFPGVIFQSDPTDRIDYQASHETLNRSSDYLVDAETSPAVRSSPQVLVAVPAYNEEQTIGDVVRAASSYADEVLVIDDGSKDETVSEASRAGATVIEHETNRGYGGALKTAFQEAHRSNAEHLVVLDGDGQHDPSDIPGLVEAQSEQDAEIVIGSRFVSGSSTNLPLYRRVGIMIVNILTNVSIGGLRHDSQIRDTQCGFRVYDQTAIKSLAADESLGDHMEASTDILYHAYRKGYTVTEVGTTVNYDVENASSYHPVHHGLRLVQNILRTIEREHPILILGVPGTISILVGIGFGYWTITNFVKTGTFGLGLGLVSTMFGLAGVLMVLTGIILHSLETHRSSDRP
mgnify:CR=1 FL=1